MYPYLNITFDRETWIRSEADGHSVWTSPPIDLPEGADEATVLIYFDNSLVATGTTYGGPVTLSTCAA